MYSRTLSRAAMPLAAAAVMSLLGARGAMAQRADYTIPQDTVVRVKLDQTVNSRTARIGDRITAAVTPGDRSGFPEGTRLEGAVTDAQRSTSDRPGVIGMDFRTAVLPDGQRAAINGSLTGLSEEDVRRSSDGRIMARRRSGGGKKMDLKWVGYGAAGGAVLGQILGGGLLKGALLGGLGGAVYSYLNRDKGGSRDFRDVSLARGTEFGVRLDRQVAFNSRGNYRYSYRPADFDENRYYSDRAYRDRVLGERQENRFGDVAVRMNGRPVTFTDLRPMQINGSLYVPLSQVARSANMRYNHVLGDDTFVLFTRNGAVRGTAGETRLSGRGPGDLTLTNAPMSINGEIYVPTEFLSDVADMRVNWDRRSMQLDLDTYGQDNFRNRNDRFNDRFPENQ